MRICLIGMPAAGKTTTGKKLAKKLDYPFIDLDQLITEQEGKTIPEIFQLYDETYFRELEAKALKIAFEQPKLVLATGGGAPCFFDNMEIINAQSLSIWIEAPIKTLVARMLNNPHRPLYQLEPEALHQKITQTYQERVIFYQKAKLVLHTT